MRIAGLKLLVAGGGIAGLAAAAILARRGARVTLLERAERFDPVGAGIQISPNGAAVLHALGLETAADRHGTPIEAVRLIEGRGGRDVMRLDLARAGYGRPYRAFHRADLIAMLAEEARDAGVAFRMGVGRERIVPGPKPGAELSDGSHLDTEMLIGADGIHSAVRPVVAGSGDSAPRFTGHVAWRAAAAAPANHPREVRLFMAPGRHLVCYPLEARGKLNLVAVETRDAWVEEGWQHRDRPENLTCAFAGLAPELRAMLDQVEEVHLWGLFQHAVPACWHLGGSGIIGDALHPTLPFMAQGGNLALEDAWVLAECLEEAPGVEQAWAAFTRRRFDRVSRAVARAGRNAGIYHLSQPLLRLGLHTGMRIAGAVAPQMPLRKFDWIYRHDVTGGT